MADISKITLPSGTTYNIKDAVARATAAGGIQLKGVTTTALTDEATTNPITIGGSSYNAVANDAVFYQKAEFVFDGTKWHEFGDMSGLGALAKKDSASGSYTPAGTVTKPTFTGSSTTSTGTFTPEGIVSKPTFTGTQGSVSVKGTPSGTIGTGTGTANYTPGGSVSAPTITVTPSTTTKYVASSASGGGSVTAGSAAVCTLPTLSTSVANETLTIGWTAGSFTANTPTAVTLPSFASQTIATGISSATSTQPEFTGTGVQLKFTGSELTSTGSFTPAGSVSQPTFTGDEGSVSVTGTPSGSVSQPTFSGTQATVTVS